MRVCSAREAEGKNVDADQLSRMAGWQTGAKNNCYTNDLPLQTLRALAEWPIIGGGFFLRRGLIEPGEELKSQVGIVSLSQKPIFFGICLTTQSSLDFPVCSRAAG